VISLAATAVLVLSIHLQVRAVEGAIPRRWLAQELNGVTPHGYLRMQRHATRHCRVGQRSRPATRGGRLEQSR
jgi:hypothetical protein